MTPDLARIDDPTCVAENRLPPHADHRWFASAREAAGGVSSFEQRLSGTWRVQVAENPDAVVPGCEQPGTDRSGWDEIEVPGHLQLQGHHRPQYVNVQYPWDGHETLEPGRAPRRSNPVATYVRTFTLDRPLAPGERVSVVFEGAESAVLVWVNGTWVGYGTDTFTPSEFDVTDALVDGENTLAARVVTWTAGSWIEDQDFFRFSGLFRDVVLRRRPAVHAEDVRVTTRVADGLDRATVRVRVRLTGEGSVTAVLDGVGPLAVHGDGDLVVEVTDPRLWSAEDPYLYDLHLEVRDAAGAVTEHVPLRVGVRRFGIEDGVLRINGRRLVLTGVNRHEFGLRGRVVTREETEADLRFMKRVGINAVRTSHYPNNGFFYDLCDEYGLYVVDEMNLESHAMWDRLLRRGLPPEEALPGDRPEWLPTLLARAAAMLERDKNHPSVVMWSCGNESYGGTDVLAVADWFRSVDDRPVHYEGVHWDPRYPSTTDVVSTMYTPAAEVEAFLADHRDRPVILCEYAHAMGNSFGAVGRYLDLAYRDPLFQGGFIWDLADQALPLTDRHGVPFFGYGGDFGDVPHDADFSGNGLLFADHTPKPFVQEVRYLYQPYRVALVDEGGRPALRVENRHLVTPSSAHACVVTLAREGVVLDEQPLETAVAPGTTGTVPLPLALPDEPGEYTVDASFRLREATRWAPAGHEVAHEQAVVVVPQVTAPERARVTGAAPAPEVVDGIHNVGVHGPGFSALFSRLHGGLLSYRYGPGTATGGGRELVASVPRPSFWHAPTSNERGWGGPAEDGQWLLAGRYPRLVPDVPQPEVVPDEGGVALTFRYLLPTAPTSTCDVTYRVDGTGRVEVTQVVRPGEGLPDMPELGMLLTTDPALHHLRWYGEGPEECYVDRRAGARLDVHTRDVRTALTPYLRPQEAGSRTGVRWAEVTDDAGTGIRLEHVGDPGPTGGMELSVLPWTPDEIESATHPNELPPVHRTVLRPALMRRGVGGDNSWGARTHPEFLLPRGQELTFRFAFRGV
ncbi:glycoside hydrolase family 2 TIM barrel-domain containing protein [Cellulomonas marina]|uniref:Beta-galactosidase n=1 Tax=Cellulomonas marina TaxID=988821 RepID=A0A1I1AJ85_9CELL|nr:glycoside hydrolase family 2 TIM barrel-domain containing protein [Cellulomonas marina]GIG30140.1 beta-galactosidase [Cellulomonas marina]SFB38075.1 beta-galactosidase [Cellulomonas marina]